MTPLKQATKICDWICSMQVTNLINPETENTTNADMNFGRFVRNYNTTDDKIMMLSTNWVSGMTIYGLLMMHDYNKEGRYLQAAKDGAHYIKALQNLIPFDEYAYGAIQEEIPACGWCHPRDSLSGAWGLLRLFKTTKNREYLYRAELFADWHMKYVLRDGYPIWSFYFDGRENNEDFGSFQAGSALFYYDLYHVTKKPVYRKTMLEMLDFYIDNFFNPEDGIHIVYKDKTGYRGDYKGAEAWSDMHKFNDDFNCAAVMAAYNLTGKEHYKKYTTDYLDWAARRQNDDGGFGQFSLSISSCVAAMNFLNGYMITKNNSYKNVAYAAVAHLKTSVLDTPENPKTDGGVLGLNHCVMSENNDTISLRVTMYAIYTFLLFHLFEEYVEKGKSADISTALLTNPMYIGLKY